MPEIAGDGAAPIDVQILEYLRDRLVTTPQVERATITDASGHLALVVGLSSAYYPPEVEDADLLVRWYTNDDFTIHYRERRSNDSDGGWECRWDRHPNSHNARDHFHPPPDAATPGENADWPADYRQLVSLVLAAVEDRIEAIWSR